MKAIAKASISIYTKVKSFSALNWTCWLEYLCNKAMPDLLTINVLDFMPEMFQMTLLQSAISEMVFATTKLEIDERRQSDAQMLWVVKANQRNGSTALFVYLITTHNISVQSFKNVMLRALQSTLRSRCRRCNTFIYWYPPSSNKKLSLRSFLLLARYVRWKKKVSHFSQRWDDGDSSFAGSLAEGRSLISCLNH